MHSPIDVIKDIPFTSDHLKNYLSKINSMIDKLRSLNDDRALVIVAALFVEKAIDDYLSSLIPDFLKIEDERDMTFSLKIKLASSFKLCHSSFFKCSHKIREIRNEFAHNIEIERINDLDSSYLISLQTHCKNWGHEEEIKDLDFIDIFQHVSKTIILNLMMRVHVNNIMTRYIRTKQFKQNFLNYISQLDPNSLSF